MKASLKTSTFLIASVLLVFTIVFIVLGSNQIAETISPVSVFRSYASNVKNGIISLINIRGGNTYQNNSENVTQFNTLLTENLHIRRCDRKGRLGNHMFQYASLLGIARRNNRTALWTNKDSDLANVFNIKMMIEDGNAGIITKDFYRIENETNSRCYDNWTESLPNRNVCVSGYRQSRLYFNNVESELRKHFTFKNVLLDQARSLLNISITNTFSNSSTRPTDCNRTLVVMHVRRGDMLKTIYVESGWIQPDLEYYERAMNYFNSRYRNVVFVLLTDDMPWCKKNIRANNLVYIQGSSSSVDLAIASLCHHAITTQGSFGLWIAWFANGVTVRPINIPTPESAAFKKLMECTAYEQHYPKNCVVL